MKLPSPSKLDLFQECSFPWTGGVAWPPFRGKGEPARFGDAVHEAIALDCQGIGLDFEALAEKHEIRTQGDRARLEATVGHALELTGLDTFDRREAELKVAFDIERNEARLISQNWDKAAGEQAGDVDYLLFVGADRLIVRDWKTGRRAMRRRIEETGQVLWYASALSALYDVNDIRIELAHVNDHGVHVDYAEFDAFALDDVRGRLRRLLEEGARRMVPVYGTHCRELYCPIVGSCPAVEAALVEVEQRASMRLEWSTTPTSDEHAAELYMRALMVRSAADQVLDGVGKHCKRGAVKLPSGKWLGYVERRGADRMKVTDDFRAALKDALGAAADECFELKTTKTAIEKVVSKVAKRGQKGKTVEALMAKAAETGALIKGAPFEVLEEFTRDEEAALPAGEVACG